MDTPIADASSPSLLGRQTLRRALQLSFLLRCPPRSVRTARSRLQPPTHSVLYTTPATNALPVARFLLRFVEFDARRTATPHLYAPPRESFFVPPRDSHLHTNTAN
mmetsp:Transcript_16697/g.51853  ORF Transcript_16697/g.51853 Transcript_16697/m.51853 type:complete len:106 (-) Transcript_16697:283-600(-)